MHSAPTAAIILIGNELLSGKIADRNAAYLTGRLHKMGVRVARILVIPDVLDTIAAEVRHHAGQYDHVFTSGGVGPTHDDITIEGVAAAFGVEVARDPLLTEILERHFQDRLTDAHLRMANVPSGAHLLHGGEITWPVVCFQNVYILPGVPEIFRAKFESIADRFRYKPMHVHAIYLNADEGVIAPALAALEADYEVSVGSYPRLDSAADHRVKITIESLCEAQVQQARAALLEALPEDQVIRVEPA